MNLTYTKNFIHACKDSHLVRESMLNISFLPLYTDNPSHIVYYHNSCTRDNLWCINLLGALGQTEEQMLEDAAKSRILLVGILLYKSSSVILENDSTYMQLTEDLGLDIWRYAHRVIKTADNIIKFSKAENVTPQEYISNSLMIG